MTLEQHRAQATLDIKVATVNGLIPVKCADAHTEQAARFQRELDAATTTDDKIKVASDWSVWLVGMAAS